MRVAGSKGSEGLPAAAGAVEVPGRPQGYAVHPGAVKNSIVTVPPVMNLADRCLDENVRQGRGDKTAIICEGREYSYREVVQLSARVASGLQHLGLRPEQRVLIVLPDSAEFVAAHFGAMRLGAVPVAVNTLLTTQDYRYLLEDSRAAALFVHEDLLDKMPDDSTWLEHVIVVGASCERLWPSGIPSVSFEQLLASGDPDFPAVPRSSDDMAFWIYSSGTTGAPKGVVHLHQDPLFSLDYGATVLGMDDDCRTLSSSKLFFSYALGCALLMPLLLGGSVVLLPERPTPARLFELASEWRPTVFLSVPTFFASALRAGVQAEAFGSVRFCISAGETLPPAIYQQWLAETGKEIVEHLGSTETLFAFLSNTPGEVQAGSSGRPIPGVQVRIVDENFADLPAGETGMLLVKTNSMAMCYWNKRSQSKQTFLGEWLRTGDMYYRDQEGFYWNCGRADDVFKASGIWISPIEVENALLQHPAVLEAAVVPAKDRDGLLKPKAFVVKAAEVSAEDLQAYVKSVIAPYKYPRWIQFVDQLPRTATGKVQRYRLREME